VDCQNELFAVGAETDVGSDQLTVVVGGVEHDPLTLAEHAEKGSLEGPGAEHDIATVVVVANHTEPGCWIVYLDDSLHDQAFSILPALMQDVHTRMRRLLLPWRTRTR
jgi:hypothetical protein